MKNKIRKDPTFESLTNQFNNTSTRNTSKSIKPTTRNNKIYVPIIETDTPANKYEEQNSMIKVIDNNNTKDMK